MGCAHSYQLPPQKTIQITQSRHLHSSLIERKQAVKNSKHSTERTNSCQKQVRILKNFVYQIKGNPSYQRKDKRNQNKEKNDENLSIKMESIFVTLQASKNTNHQRNKENINNLRERTRPDKKSNYIKQSYEDTLAQKTLQQFQALCQLCFSKLARYSHFYNKNKECIYCRGYGIVLYKSQQDEEPPKCQKSMCFKKGRDIVSLMSMCKCCYGRGGV